MLVSGNRLQQPGAQGLRHSRLEIQPLDRRPDPLRVSLRQRRDQATRQPPDWLKKLIVDQQRIGRKPPLGVSYLDPRRLADNRAAIHILGYMVDGPYCPGYPSGREIIIGCRAGAVTVREVGGMKVVYAVRWLPDDEGVTAAFMSTEPLPHNRNDRTTRRRPRE